MFVEESRWIGERLSAAELPDGGTALDVGSSTGAYRAQTQPHIATNVLSVLTAHRIRVVHLDIKADAGVDVVADLCAPDFDPESIAPRPDVVLCNNTLVHVADVPAAIAALRRLPAPGGLLLVTTPGRYRKVTDPLDNGYRPTAAVLESDVAGAGGYDVLERAEVRIDDPGYYRSLAGRPSRQLLAGRWVPLPGAAEWLRYRVPSKRWSVSAVLLRRHDIQGARAGG